MNTSTLAFKPIAVGSTSVSHHLPGLRDKFLAPEADCALVRYNGVLGLRAIKDAVLLTRNGKHVAFDLPDDARQEFRGLCEALLESRFPDWSESEGAEGVFVWDLASDTLMHEHRLRCLCDSDIPEGFVAVPADFDAEQIPF